METSSRTLTFYHCYPFEILESHLDSFGHVNHATYLVLLEQARWDILNQAQLGLFKIKETQIGPVILEAQIKYKKELLLHDKIEIWTTMEEKGKKIGKIMQVILKPDKSIAAEAALVYGHMDLKKRKIIPVPEAWVEMANKIKNASETLNVEVSL